MTDFDNTNRGSIWKNDKKATEKHPDFTGSLNVEGVEYWVSAWRRKEGANPNAPALSFSVKRKEEAPQVQQAPAAQQGGGDPFMDDIPFAQYQKHMVI